MKQKVSVLAILLFLFMAAFFLWWSQSVKPLMPSSTETFDFTISQGESTRVVADHLFKNEFIRSPVAFFLLSRFGGWADRLQAGDFRLSPSMDLFTITEALTHGSSDIQVTIPEGWRREEIALSLAKSLNIPESEFLKEAREGYLFPDTYKFPKDAGSTAVTGIFSANFQRRVNDQIISKAAEKGLTLDELINIASLVEREAKLEQDRPLIASVIRNRLEIGMKLDIDATVQYALGYQPQQKSWWKKDLTMEDLSVDSPYNTYHIAGLPPEPISNPGLAVINAVIEAPDTDYLFYIADKTGKSHFATTIEEHRQNIATYLNL